jgi:hypothetical protein
MEPEKYFPAEFQNFSDWEQGAARRLFGMN